MTRREPLSRLKHVATETAELFDQLGSAPERGADKRFEVLSGVAGGGIALLIGYFVSIVVHGVTFALAGPIFCLIGIPAAILLSRGPRRIRFEGKIHANRIAASEVLARIKSLPKNAPPEITERLWANYAALTADLSGSTSADLSASTSADPSRNTSADLSRGTSYSGHQLLPAQGPQPAPGPIENRW